MGGEDSPKSVSTSAPIIASLRVQTSAYGRCIPVVFGTTRISGNLIDYDDFVAIPQTSTQPSGGEGGKGGGGGASSPSNTTYTYTAMVLLALCHGPIASIGNVWRDKLQSGLGAFFTDLFTGSASQTAWGYLTTNHPSKALAYRNLAYVAHAAEDLGDSAGLGNFSFEVKRLTVDYGLPDAGIKDVISEIVTNGLYGLGLPGAVLGDLTALHDYCGANNIWVSPAYVDREPAAAVLLRLADIANAGPFWSEDKLKIVPYGDTAITANGFTFTPDLTPQYDFADADYLDKEQPVRLVRKTPADLFNQAVGKFFNRANQYNEQPVEFKDQADIEVNGLKPDPSERAYHEIALQASAQVVIDADGRRGLYGAGNIYETRVTARYDLLEPMDLVTLTDLALDLNRQLVRIRKIEEDEEEGLNLEVEEVMVGSASPALYSSQVPGGYSADYNTDPGASNAPIFIEAPVVLTTSGLEIWLAASGSGKNWLGAQVHVSQDNATYKFAGTLPGKSRMGTLRAALAAGADPDTVNTLSVDLTMSAGVLLSGTQQDADLANTLCYADGEFVSYKTATLIAANKYDLTSLGRGLYNSKIGAHNIGSAFARMDNALVKVPYTSDRIGTSIWVKLVPFNTWGFPGPQSLATVPAYQYNIQGTALLSTLPPPTNLTSKYIGGYTNIVWTPATDFREPDYEVRIGPSWETGQVLGRLPASNPAFITQGDGMYWIASHFRTPDGFDLYSSAESIVLAGSVLTRNVMVSWDERATGWSGTFTPSALATSEGLVLSGAGNILTEANVLTVDEVLHYGGITSSGSYQIPASHQVDIQRVAPCNVIVSYVIHGVSVMDNVLTYTDVLSVEDFTSVALGPKVSITPQIRTSNGDAFGAWQNYTPGAYNARKFDMQVLLSSSDPQVYPVVSSLVFSVDVPDRLDTGTNVALGAGGTTFTYSAQFNGGPSGASIPNVQITVLNAIAGDDLVLSGQTVNGFTAQVLNGGSGVARNINWAAQGY